MVSSRSFATACALLLPFLTLASPTTPEPPKDFKPAGNKMDCPAAHATKYTGPNDGEWGLLCGWDPGSTTFHWGPFYGKTFQQRIAECESRDECGVVSFTGPDNSGTCYLKESTRNYGLTHTGKMSDRAAININRRTYKGLRKPHRKPSSTPSRKKHGKPTPIQH